MIRNERQGIECVMIQTHGRRNQIGHTTIVVNSLTFNISLYENEEVEIEQEQRGIRMKEESVSVICDALKSI